ncbi:MAG: hypothetical protein IJ367_04790, partial [Clostridia bacterium]|nr:hypothetical protein [Clostridia bacterium]
AETALKRYPNDFRVVFRSGSMYEHLGLENYEEATMLRAVELLEQAILLLPQNTDLEVCEASISTQIALCYLLMGQTEKGTELLKKYDIMK